MSAAHSRDVDSPRGAYLAGSVAVLPFLTGIAAGTLAERAIAKELR